MAAPRASVIDVPSCFEYRVNELGLGNYLPKMRQLKMDTFAKLAFASQYVPNQSPYEIFVKDVVLPISGREAPDLDIVVGLKRLFYDAFTLSVADIKERADDGGFCSRMLTWGFSVLESRLCS